MNGDEIIIANAGEPVAILSPIHKTPAASQPSNENGVWAYIFWSYVQNMKFSHSRLNPLHLAHRRRQPLGQIIQVY